MNSYTSENLTESQVIEIAILSKLNLSPEEIKKFQGQLSSILGHIEQLNKLDTADVEETSNITGLQNKYREDANTPSLTRDEALSGAKNRNKGFFVVPAVFEE